MKHHQQLLKNHLSIYNRKAQSQVSEGAIEALAKYFSGETLEVLRLALGKCWGSDGNEFPGRLQIKNQIQDLCKDKNYEEKRKQGEKHQQQTDAFNREVDRAFADIIQRVGPDKTLSAYNKYVTGVWGIALDNFMTKSFEKSEDLRHKLFMPLFLSDLYKANGDIDKAIEIGKAETRS